MASRWAIATTFAVFVLAACRAPVQPDITEVRSGGGKSRVKTTASAPAGAKGAGTVASLVVRIQGPAPEIVTRYGTSASVPTGGVPVAAGPAAAPYALAQAGPFVPVAQAPIEKALMQNRFSLPNSMVT